MRGQRARGGNMRWLYGWLLTGLMMATISVAWAHKPSDSYLTLRLNGQIIDGQWDIALRDLEFAIGLDGDGDGNITWGELRARHGAIADYALSHLSVTANGISCLKRPGEQLVDNHSDGAYTVLRFTLDCPDTGAPLKLTYQLFFDLDPSHRGLVKIEYPTAVQTAVLAPDQLSLELAAQVHSGWQQLGSYWRQGIWHIWQGTDHILFLLALLLPSVRWREQGQWRQADSFREVLITVLAIVTAFTIAHSITLSMAVLGFVNLPSRLVESAIAATIVLAALNNLYPCFTKRRWLLGFCLGLIHGFGFASALAGLHLPGSALALALAGFNLGVETGQLAIVAAFLPLAYLMRGSWFYHRVALDLGSLTVAAVALVWLAERGLDTRLVL